MQTGSACAGTLPSAVGGRRGYGGRPPGRQRLRSAPDTMAVLAIGRTPQRGRSVVIENVAMSSASVMRTVPFLTPAFIAAKTSSGWALSS